MKKPLFQRILIGMGVALAAVLLLCGAYIALFGWNWLRSPVERYALHKTGRELSIAGDLTVQLGWPVLHLQAAGVTFANPPWAKEKEMVAAKGVDVAVDLPPLLHRTMVFPEVRLDRATVFLERAADGRKSWLLDLAQQDENARMNIGRIALTNGVLGYDDVAQKTRLRAELSTSTDGSNRLQFNALGRYKGQAVKVRGSGGPLLALRDTSLPYPINLEASAGSTSLKAEGTITGLLTFTAVDMHMALQGDSLERLYPLLGIALPATPAYTTQGHLLHSGNTWRYEQFSGRMGTSDLAGLVQVVLGGKRPALTADVRSERLALDDLGPLIGARAGSAAPSPPQQPMPAQPRQVLPVLPFNAERWDTVDAEVQLRAKTLVQAKALPLEDLVAHLSLQGGVLTLDPLDFGLAGGQLNANITLDGRKQPIQARARLRAKKVLLAKLFPTIDLSKSSIGEVNGEFDLDGTGNSVDSMLATSNGKLRLVVAGGRISKLLMEKIGLHLWEILALSLTGDKLVQLRCAVADFDVKRGNMQANALVFDTEVTTLLGSGSIDLKDEKLDLTLNPRTKDTSPMSLRSPIYIRGSFAQPRAEVDKGRVALRAAGAVALGALNPLLALVPLVDAGPGKDSDCGRLVHNAGQ